eukprot:2203220-Pyramimonas_sp.AAC.1
MSGLSSYREILGDRKKDTRTVHHKCSDIVNTWSPDAVLKPCSSLPPVGGQARLKASSRHASTLGSRPQGQGRAPRGPGGEPVQTLPERPGPAR